MTKLYWFRLVLPWIRSNFGSSMYINNMHIKRFLLVCIYLKMLSTYLNWLVVERMITHGKEQFSWYFSLQSNAPGPQLRHSFTSISPCFRVATTSLTQTYDVFTLITHTNPDLPLPLHPDESGILAFNASDAYSSSFICNFAVCEVDLHVRARITISTTCWHWPFPCPAAEEDGAVTSLILWCL